MTVNRKLHTLYNSSTVKGQLYVFNLAHQMQLCCVEYGTNLQKNQMQQQPSETFITNITHCWFFFFFKSCFICGQRGKFSLLSALCSEKQKGGTDDLTPPVNSDFTQLVITCFQNRRDWLTHTNVVFIKGCDRWWVWVGCSRISS